MTWVAHALEVDETRGMMKAVVDAETNEIIEIMSAVQMAMQVI
jgi:pyruvate/2-oxoglutarate dehydrogenase complex dihydrolipoamide dehydrogenase (E3) component